MSSRSRNRKRERSPDRRREPQYETKEERRARRLAKREAKRRKREGAPETEVARKMGYSDVNNPFGDNNLSQKFVWKAKRDKLKQQGIDPARHEKDRVRRRRTELKSEVASVKARRDDREEEREQWQREQRRLQLERELGTLEEWQAQEERFHAEQARKRAQLRLQAGRAKPIDRVFKTLANLDDLDFDVRAPQHIFANLDETALCDVLQDIDTYLDIDGDDRRHLQFWRALKAIGEERLGALRRGANNSAVHHSVAGGVDQILNGKTANQLQQLQKDIKEKLAEPDESIDVEYWENLLSRCRSQLAHAVVNEIHREGLEQRLARLEAALAMDESSDDEAATDDNDVTEEAAAEIEAAARLAKEEFGFGADVDDNNTKKEADSKEPGNEKALAAAIEAAKASMGEEEEGDANFDNQVLLENQKYSWSDKFRPRKPKYFNRVHSGYHWNSYNRTHYDHDNPPPKIIQGYKFNIFLPDLIDKSKPPSYVVLPADTPDTCLLVFKCGAPYEDIAFKIVNSEWCTGRKSGFRCKWHNNVLSLHFNLKFYRYRK